MICQHRREDCLHHTRSLLSLRIFCRQVVLSLARCCSSQVWSETPIGEKVIQSPRNVPPPPVTRTLILPFKNVRCFPGYVQAHVVWGEGFFPHHCFLKMAKRPFAAFKVSFCCVLSLLNSARTELFPEVHLQTAGAVWPSWVILGAGFGLWKPAWEI